jgi:hypothetical protein
MYQNATKKQPRINRKSKKTHARQLCQLINDGYIVAVVRPDGRIGFRPAEDVQ